MNHHVFTYGSLMFAEVWGRVVSASYRSIRGVLREHARFAVREQAYPGMIASTGAAVDGVLHLDVDEADLARLDHFEGDDYRRQTVSIMCVDGVERRSETYVYLLHDRLLDRPWEPDAFAMDRFIATYCHDKLSR